jgi:hypothetical protein
MVDRNDAMTQHGISTLICRRSMDWCWPVPLLQVQESGVFDGYAVVASAAYLRDRVGVPRDLKLPAARQLRAHLNWLIDTLQQQPMAA